MHLTMTEMWFLFHHAGALKDTMKWRERKLRSNPCVLPFTTKPCCLCVNDHTYPQLMLGEQWRRTFSVLPPAFATMWSTWRGSVILHLQIIAQVNLSELYLKTFLWHTTKKGLEVAARYQLLDNDMCQTDSLTPVLLDENVHTEEVHGTDLTSSTKSSCLYLSMCWNTNLGAARLASPFCGKWKGPEHRTSSWPRPLELSVLCSHFSHITTPGTWRKNSRGR